MSDSLKRRGVVLAGGHGTRLRPITRVTNKHMVPILNEPMLTYPLHTLRSLCCTDVLIISGGEHIGHIAEFFQSEYKGMQLMYKVQKEAGGIAQALALAEDFATGDPVTVVLGDNIFDNYSLPFLNTTLNDKEYARIFTKRVTDAQRFGVYDPRARRVVEKPVKPVSDQAVVGLYMYPPDVFEVIKTLQPSERGELEITDVNNHYLEKNRCEIQEIKGFWSDAGTPESLYRAIKYVAEKMDLDPLDKKLDRV